VFSKAVTPTTGNQKYAGNVDPILSQNKLKYNTQAHSAVCNQQHMAPSPDTYVWHSQAASLLRNDEPKRNEWPPQNGLTSVGSTHTRTRARTRAHTTVRTAELCHHSVQLVYAHVVKVQAVIVVRITHYLSDNSNTAARISRDGRYQKHQINVFINTKSF
jgi:hypothetical protein